MQKFICTKCGYLHDKYRAECFKCGENDTLRLTTIKVLKKKKKVTGTTIHINI